MAQDLTRGRMLSLVATFSVPYLVSCFLQSLYGLADLYIIGYFCSTSAISAVAIGSQVLHMVAVFLMGMAMGATVIAGKYAGSHKLCKVATLAKNGVALFCVLGVALAIVAIFEINPIVRLLRVPPEAVLDAKKYLLVCFVGVPFIAIYNAMSAIYRGMGDTKTPMVVVFLTGSLNIALDLLFIGKANEGSKGAAVATVLSQFASSIAMLFIYHFFTKKKVVFSKECGTFASLPLDKNNQSIGKNTSSDATVLAANDGAACGGSAAEWEGNSTEGQAAEAIKDTWQTPSKNKKSAQVDFSDAKAIIAIGAPIALQDVFIQVSFLVITAITNSLGVKVSASVGIVEKVISFLFLVNSSVSAAVCAISSQNIGAGLLGRAKSSLKVGVSLVFAFGVAVFVACLFFSDAIILLFTKDIDVVRLGASYLRTYSVDCAVAGVHFCFSAYFCACRHSVYSFIHNMASVVFVRIPLSLVAVHGFLGNLYLVGLAAPLGSFLSCIICIIMYFFLAKKSKIV